MMTGFSVQGVAEAAVRRAIMDGNRSLGISAFGSRLSLFDVVVKGTRRPACSEADTCLPGSDIAHAVGGVGTSSITAERVRLEDSELCGLWLTDGNDLPSGAGQVQTSLRNAFVLFTRSGTTWQQEAYLKASNTDADDVFGISLAVDGDTLAVGASDEASFLAAGKTTTS